MKTATIENVTQEEFDTAVQTVIAGIKANDPKLDTRYGTALRSLLVNPEARIDATISKQLEYARNSTSLKALLKEEESGNEIDVDDVNAILSNYNIASSTGTVASGIVKVSVTDGSQTYSVPEGSEFSTLDGLKFKVTSTTIASGSSSLANTRLYKGSASYFLLVPVKACSVGASYNIEQGTSLSTNVSLYTFIAAEAYKPFDGGSDVEDLSKTIDKIPSGLSIRGFVNKTACEGMLRDKFDNGDYPIIACSTVGYGNKSQRRDKHNVLGVGIGGRVDLYVRNFGDVYTISKIVTGKRITDTDNSYIIHISQEDFPGNCWVKDVSIGNSDSEVNSSLEFSCTRTADGTDTTWHDIDVRKDSSEAFNSVWQGLDVIVSEVQDDVIEETKEFKVTAYCLPQAKELQDYVDSDSIRSVSTDVIVRCPILCNVTVSATVVYDTDNPIDESSTKYKIRKYINNLGFVKSLSRSEIVHILKSCGAVSVDLGKKDMLFGTLYDARGKEYNLGGDSLQLNGLADNGAMLTSDTTIFVVEPENIQLTLIPNE